MGAAHALRRDAGQSVVRLIHKRRQRRVPQRDVYSSALSGLLAMVEGGQNGTHGVHAGHDVDPRHADLGWTTIGFTGDGHDAAASLHRQVERHFVSTGSVLSVARDAAHDDMLGHLANDGLKGSRFEVLNHDVCVGHQRAYALLFLLDVDRLDALAAVAREVVGGDFFSVKPGLKGRTP